jgi:hypothetical protein
LVNASTHIEAGVEKIRTEFRDQLLRVDNLKTEEIRVSKEIDSLNELRDVSVRDFEKSIKGRVIAVEREIAEIEKSYLIARNKQSRELDS